MKQNVRIRKRGLLATAYAVEVDRREVARFANRRDAVELAREWERQAEQERRWGRAVLAWLFG